MTARVMAILAILAVLLPAVGAGMIFLPAGVIVAGANCAAALYVMAYLDARRNR